MVQGRSFTPGGAASGGSIADASGAITTGGTAQTALAAQYQRRYLFILNPSTATETLWINLVGTATVNGEATGSVPMAPGQSFVWEDSLVPANAISVLGATTGHKFTIYVG